jgi:hypothetical protein
MSKIHVYTQEYENYAWVDGELQTGSSAYWKAKGGRDIFITNFDGDKKTATTVVESLRNQIEIGNDAYISEIIGFDIVEDDFMTEFEKSQLDYEGQIRFPAEVIELETV